VRRPCGVFSSSYAKDKAIFQTPAHWIWFVAFVGFLIVLPMLFPSSIIDQMIILFIQLIAVLGLMLLTGYCGQISIGQSAFMAVGAFASAILVSNLGWPFWLALISAILLSVIIGLIFGLPALRIKGFYLAMSTLAAQFIIVWAIIHVPKLTGGSDGMRVARINLMGFMLDTHFKYYYFSFAFAALFTYFAKNLARSRVGRAWIAIRDNDIVAEVMGINIAHYKLLAFAICSAFAGVAGALWAHYVPGINYEHFTLWDSIWFLAMIVIGGSGTIIGAIFGLLFIRVLDQLVTILFPFITQNIPTLNEASLAGALLSIYGLAVVLFLILEPRGLAHRWELFKAWYRLWPFKY
jgi:branched-chain amino acid transport system permease protein